MADAAPKAFKVIGDDSPSWSPDGKWIAFTSFRTPRSDIWVMHPDGSAQHALTHDNAYDDQAAWSPDGKQIAFTSDRSGVLEIWVMNADGTDRRQLTSAAAGTNFDPAWSPDGRRIAFRSDRDSLAQIYTMRSDGSDVVRITHDFQADYSPSWGPDGRILFVTQRGTGGKAAVWIMNGDGSDEHQFAPAASPTANQATPMWSPDGKRVVFTSDIDGPISNTELYLVRADGTDAQRLTTYPGGDTFPAWSPDGTRIAFARGPGQFRNEVYVMNADGSQQRALIFSKLIGIDIGLVPAAPRPGQLFAVAYDVEPSSGGDAGKVAVRCTAKVGARGLKLRSSGYYADFKRASCVWRLPTASRGKTVTTRIAVRGPRGTISQRVAFRVR